MPVHVYRIDPKKKKKSILDGLSLNTYLLLINVFVFVVVFPLWVSGKISPDYFALKPLNVLNGQYLWTFVTSIFMHGGIFHIFANMISLFFIGSLVQRILGSRRYLYFYLSSGIFAGIFFVLLSLAFPADLNAYAVGASGALFGLVGLLIVLTPNLPVYAMFIPIPIKMKYAGPGLLAILWLISAAGDIPVGNTAHLGGLIAGLIYGIYLKNKFPNKTRNISKFFS